MTQPPPTPAAARTPRLRAPLALGLALLLTALLAAGCVSRVQPDDAAEGPVRVVATTNFIADVATEIGGPDARVTALMGPGVDPHLYKASAGDVRALREADLALYGGLHLEARMAEVFEGLPEGTTSVAVSEAIPADRLLPVGEHEYDPHVWFSIPLWRHAVQAITDGFVAADPANEAAYRERELAYLRRMDDLDEYARRRLAEIPERSRVLVTSHDAFRYLGRDYGLEVEAIQGISTADEASTADVDRVSDVIAERGLRSVFVESAVSPQTIEAVLESAAAKGQRASIGGELLADSAGSAGTPEGTYLGMVRHNVDAIVDGLS
jgi:manganese/zinc/iron transport system substrate-binding protein